MPRASNIFVAIAILLLLVTAVGLGVATPNSSDSLRFGGTAEMALLGGKVITVASDNSIAQALAIKGGRIIAVGDDATIRKLIGPKTQVIQLHGKTVLPGFIDAHTHVEGIADYRRMLDLHVPPLSSVDEMLRKIEERAVRTANGEWIVGAGGWGQPMPTRQQLDSVTRDHPVLVRESAHEIIVNTKALELAHIDKHTPDPPGGKIWKDAKTGEPTGRLSEMFGRMLALMPKPSFAERVQAVKDVLQFFARNGVTSIYDFPSPDGIRIYQDLLSKSELPVRLRCQLILNVPRDRDPDSTFDEDFLRYGIHRLRE